MLLVLPFCRCSLLSSPLQVGEPQKHSGREGIRQQEHRAPGRGLATSLCQSQEQSGSAAPVSSSAAGDDLCTARGKKQRQIKTFGSAICFQGVVFGSLSEDNFLGGLVQEDRKSNLG